MCHFLCFPLSSPSQVLQLTSTYLRTLGVFSKLSIAKTFTWLSYVRRENLGGPGKNYHAVLNSVSFNYLLTDLSFPRFLSHHDDPGAEQSICITRAPRQTLRACQVNVIPTGTRVLQLCRCPTSPLTYLNVNFSRSWCGSVDGTPACEPKGRWFDSQSGHMPGLQVN